MFGPTELVFRLLDRFVPEDVYVPIVCKPTGIVPTAPKVTRKEMLYNRREAARRRSGTLTSTAASGSRVSLSFFRPEREGGRVFRDEIFGM